MNVRKEGRHQVEEFHVCIQLLLKIRLQSNRKIIDGLGWLLVFLLVAIVLQFLFPNLDDRSIIMTATSSASIVTLMNQRNENK